MIILLVTGTMTGLQFVLPQVLSELERTPAAISNHEWWRLFTPLLVHSGGWKQIAFNFPAILILGSFVERILGSWRLLIVYLLCGLIGEIAGYFWQPNGAGASVAGAGLLGVFAFWLLTKAVPGKIGGVFLLASAATLTYMRDIHGPPILAGFSMAWMLGLSPRMYLRFAFVSQRDGGG